MSEAIPHLNLGLKRSAPSGNSPDRMRQQSDVQRVSPEVDAEISDFIRSSPNAKMLKFGIGLHKNKSGTLSGSTRGPLASTGPDVLVDLVDFCEKYRFKNFDADLKDLEKCKTHLDKTAKQDVNKLGDLLLTAIDKAMDMDNKSSPDLFSATVWGGVLDHAFFNAPQNDSKGTNGEDFVVQEKTTMAGWNREFVGTVDEALWVHIKECLYERSLNKKYANLCPIIQSSGTGKSRAVDQLGRMHFILPICLRDPETTGFPPADDSIRKFLTGGDSKLQTEKHVEAFLFALFRETLQLLRDLYENDPDMDYWAMAGDFRRRMTEGQTMKHTNVFRTNFYSRVVDAARIIASRKHVENSESADTASGAKGMSVDEGPASSEELMKQGESSADQTSKSRGSEVTDALKDVTKALENTSIESQNSGKGQTERKNDTPTRAATEKSITYFAFWDLQVFLRERVLGRDSSELTAGEDSTNFIPEEKKLLTDCNPLVIIAFDEAAPLTEAKGTENPVFDTLRSKLRKLNKCSLFTLFLSTTGKISAFISPSGMPDSSLRLLLRELELNLPFTATGFDLFAKRGKVEGEDVVDQEGLFALTLDEITSESYMAHLGRALWASRLDNASEAGLNKEQIRTIKEEMVLFAAVKLLNKPLFSNSDTDVTFTEAERFACLAQRLPLEFTSTTYVSRNHQREQVENHMRICLKVDPSLESMVTLAASEPLLSEAAYAIMQNSNFHTVDTLYDVMSGFSIDKGDRGEFLALLLLILARDAAVRKMNDESMWMDMKLQRNEATDEPVEWKRAIPVSTFIESLFNGLEPKILDGIRFHFKDAKVHFNHFKKVHEHKVLNRTYLLRLLARGAGVLCANSQTAVDAVIAYLIGQGLSLEQIGCILVQVKNAREFANEPWDTKPKETGKKDGKESGEKKPEGKKPDGKEPDGKDKKWLIFDKMDQFDLDIYNADDNPHPVIRICLIMGSKEPVLRARQIEIVNKKGKKYVAFDIWCTGLSSEYLRPIQKEKEDDWTALVDTSCSWEDLYKMPPLPQPQKDKKRQPNPMRFELQTMDSAVATPWPFWYNYFPLPGSHTAPRSLTIDVTALRRQKQSAISARQKIRADKEREKKKTLPTRTSARLADNKSVTPMDVDEGADGP
ncbi:hypothetical protein DFH11DRAFT_1876339 [Phellopilus nigrolimitatus]|nr:hypothetical protein DFH11DRAFT_1876339 [Phellopilus nigrolimitatus]